jgi:hypothetical protein
MLPISLQPEQFAHYPHEAQSIAVEHLATLRQLPLSFLPNLLRELIEYDYKFPAERHAIDGELQYLASLTAPQLQSLLQGFAALQLSSSLEKVDWVNAPALFVEQQSAYLWSTHQLDAFRIAATRYGEALDRVLAAPALAGNRLGIAIIGQGATAAQEMLFRDLRPHGTYFSSIRPDNGLEQLLQAAEARAQRYPLRYGHWYVDGGALARATPSLTTVGYEALSPMRAQLLSYMQSQIAKPGMGPEELRTNLARLTPDAVGVSAAADEVLSRFQLRLFTEGSGTQIFSTTFAQWTTREALRRAQPLTLLVRYAPRQRQKPMNEMLSPSDQHPALDPAGSLVDADFAAYYHWINQQRLGGADRSSFIVWFEGHTEALVIAPTLPRGTRSDSALDMRGLIQLATT